jgi:amino acid adenylation domain-containing protein
MLMGENVELQTGYLQNRLHAVPPVQLLLGFQKAFLQNNTGETISFSLDNDLTKKLQLFSHQCGATIYQILLTAFKVLLFRYNHQEEISVAGLGTVSKMNNQDASPLFSGGLLTFQSRMDGNTGFSVFLQQIKALTESPDYQKTDSQSPLHGLFILLDEKGIPSVGPESTGIFQEALSKTDLMLIMADGHSGIHGTVIVRPEKYHKENIERMIIHFNELLDSVTIDPEQMIGAIKMLTREEEESLLVEFNNTLVEYPKNKTLIEIFQEQVLLAPDHIALQLGDETMSYKQLDEHSNRLARYLIARGQKNGDNIALLTTRGFDMIIGMYAIMKAGGAYVPIDPDYPLDRQEYILKHSSVKLVLADHPYQIKDSVAPDHYIEIGCIEHIESYSNETLLTKPDSSQLAYTMYTSGSTGRPKGVMIEHHALVNLVQWVNRKFNIGSGDRLLFITSMCFDLSVYDVFGILSAGGTVVIARKQDILDQEKLQDMMQDNDITFWNSVPTTMDFLIRNLENSKRPYEQRSLKTVFLSGDWVPVDLPDRIRAYFPCTEIISLGGATEGTVWSSYYPVKKIRNDRNSIPYGKPIQNTFFYILNEQLQPVPPGVPGELYIGGVGVARGYANDLQKTDYSFVLDPFNSQAQGRMYRTGDLGRMLPDMNIEFLGRKDHQVKIRGFRVDLGEIENVLKQSDLIKEVVVLAKNDRTGQKKLTGYIVTDELFKREVVTHYLKSKLPDYMIPAAWLQLDSLPITSNGKIDRKTLLELEVPLQTGDRYAAPTNDLERIFVKIWQEIFGLDKVGIDDNFFELGGDSLIAVHAISKVKAETGNILPSSIFFENPTIKQQVISLLKSDANFTWNSVVTNMNFPSLVPIKKTGNLPPLYLVHGLSLNVMAFQELSNLLDHEQPLYGLQALGLSSAQTSTMTIEKLAAYYLEEVLMHNPEGPYYIGGYSFGAFVAYEMGKQLKSLGKTLIFLTIIDTDTDETESTPELLKIIPLPFLKQFIWLKFKTGYFVKYPYHAIRNLYADNKKEVVKNWYELLPGYLRKIVDNFSVALRKYKLQPYDVNIELYHVEDENPDSIEKKFDMYGWKKYASHVRLHTVPGDHLSLLKHPHVNILTKLIQNSLMEANRSKTDLKKIS